MKKTTKRRISPQHCNLGCGAGFTLIETLVVISITIILAGVLLVYNRSNEGQIVLYRDQAVIVGLLNRAKSLAIQKYREPAFSDYSACAFGVHFEPSPSRDFVLFQDLGLGGCTAGRVYAYNDGAVPPEELQRISLDSRLRFVGIPASGLDILFVPPEVSILTNSPDGLPIAITVETNDGKFVSTATIGAAGQIVQ